MWNYQRPQDQMLQSGRDTGSSSHVCLHVHVHLEILNDLSTDSFILSLKRFIAWRGQVKCIMNDNGTNFIGAEWELKETLNRIDQNRITNFLSQHCIDWEFNPPSSPWMGGICEALIKPVKHALKVVIIVCLLTKCYLLFMFESLLNQRPLTYLSDDLMIMNV